MNRRALTPTQERVAERMGRGLSYAQAAEDLGVAPSTVKAHVQCIAMKLDNPESLPPKSLVSLWAARQEWKKAS